MSKASAYIVVIDLRGAESTLTELLLEYFVVGVAFSLYYSHLALNAVLRFMHLF